MRTYECDVCGQVGQENDIGKLSPELQAPNRTDICKTCNARVSKALQNVEMQKRNLLVQPKIDALRAEEDRVHKEFVVPAALAEIETIQMENGLAGPAVPAGTPPEA